MDYYMTYAAQQTRGTEGQCGYEEQNPAWQETAGFIFSFHIVSCSARAREFVAGMTGRGG